MRLFGISNLATTLLTVGSLALTAPNADSRPSTPPRVDLGRITLDDDGPTARVRRGGHAKLTIDPQLQRATRRLLASAHPVEGAAVVADARNGRVLAWTSYRRGKGRATALLTSSSAPAASLFKIVTTAALLEKKVRPDKRICFAGGRQRIQKRHLVAPRTGEATCSTFMNALGFSHNAVYAQLATRHLDRSSLEATAERLGFGKNAPFDVPARVGSVNLPDGELEFARAAAGFRGSTMSPVGAAHLALTISTRGLVGRLRIVESAGEYRAPRGMTYEGRALHEWYAIQIRKMMEVTTHSGTSLEAFTNASGRSYLGRIRVAGKTGTLRPRPSDPTTTWFTGFAPSRKPRVVVSVLLKNGSVWRRRANEVARDVLRVYFAEKGYRGVTNPFDDDLR